MLKRVAAVAGEPVGALDLQRLEALPHHQVRSPAARVLLSRLHLQACSHPRLLVRNRPLLQAFNLLRPLVCNPLLRPVQDLPIQPIGTTPASINLRIQAARNREELRRSSARSSSKVLNKVRSVAQPQVQAALSKISKHEMNVFAAI
jgi:hypothetical protein